MKNSFLIAAAAAFTLASCQSDDNLATTEVAQNNETPVSFSAYSTSAMSTRGIVNTTDIFKEGDADGLGIGVFAFYQPAVNGAAGAGYTTSKYPTPDFMYNEHIYIDDTKWKYAPVKYWPNNKNDELSFFAYAPYDSETTWEDLGISTDATGKNITKSFNIYNDVEDQEDYLFASPVLNMTKPTGDAAITQSGSGQAYTDTTKNNSDVVEFDFKHVTSKINLYVGVNVDKNTPATGSTTDKSNLSAWDDENTEIEIKSIEFKDLATTLTCKYNISTDKEEWSAAGEQNIKVVPSDKDNADIIKKSTWGTTAGVKWHRVLACADVTKPDTVTADDEYMFIAPQTLEELKDKEVVITYVVKTTDSSNSDNNSEITNVITKTWDDFLNVKLNDGFQKGKQYRLYFLIGMQSVKVAATVSDWADTTTEHVVDIPAANE